MNLNSEDEYYYIRNAQGDIIGLYDKTGTKVVSYTYDSWGKLISIKDQNEGVQLYKAISNNYHHSKGKVSDDTSNPISDGMEKRIPNSELNPPKARGKKPTSKKDGKPIEIHNKGQNPNGPFEELYRTDHRLGENYRKNHPNFRYKSKIDRDKFAKDVRRYWKSEWDSGRWSNYK